MPLTPSIMEAASDQFYSLNNKDVAVVLVTVLVPPLLQAMLAVQSYPTT